jgi:methyl-accepting chemotaxis protein
VREQDLATNDISQNVQQTAIAANEVSINIVTVSNVSDLAGAAAGSVLQAALSVSRQADCLASEMSGFLNQLRVAYFIG